MKEGFHKKLKNSINNYILEDYKVSEYFSKEEKYGIQSQVRRAMVSVMLNYIGGYARIKKKVSLNFYEISYGSLQESNYVFYLACRLNYISQKDYLSLHSQKERLTQMLWKTIKGIEEDIQKPENIKK